MTGAVEQSRTRWVAEALAVAAAYVVAATLRFVFPFTEQGASWVWLPSGVALAGAASSRRSLLARHRAWGVPRLVLATTRRWHQHSSPPFTRPPKP